MKVITKAKMEIAVYLNPSTELNQILQKGISTNCILDEQGILLDKLLRPHLWSSRGNTCLKFLRYFPHSLEDTSGRARKQVMYLTRIIMPVSGHAYIKIPKKPCHFLEVSFCSCHLFARLSLDILVVKMVLSLLQRQQRYQD